MKPPLEKSGRGGLVVPFVLSTLDQCLDTSFISFHLHRGETRRREEVRREDDRVFSVKQAHPYWMQRPFVSPSSFLHGVQPAPPRPPPSAQPAFICCVLFLSCWVARASQIPKQRDYVSFSLHLLTSLSYPPIPHSMRLANGNKRNVHQHETPLWKKSTSQTSSWRTGAWFTRFGTTASDRRFRSFLKA